MKNLIIRHGRLVSHAIVLVATVLMTAYFVLPVVNFGKYRVIEDERIARLKHIAAATRIYRGRTGAAPKALHDLDGIKLRTGRGVEFTYGSDSLVRDGVVPFEYLPQVAEARNAQLARTVPLAYATVSDNIGRYYCVYADETIELLTREEIRKRIVRLHDTLGIDRP